jgi:hypothetical protein
MLVYLIVLGLYLKYFFREPFFPQKKLRSRPNIVVSLTTSPDRLKNLNFSTLPEGTRIVLNLPLLFKNKFSYDPLEVEKIQNNGVYINWCTHDLGPQLKLLGLFSKGHFISQIKCSDILVVIDDDTLYDPKLVMEYFVFFSKVSEPTIASGKIDLIYGNVIQPGYHSFALQAKHIDCSKFLQLNKQFAIKECKTHDDFVFSAIFKKLHFKQKKIDVIEPLQLPTGFGSDALFWQQPSHIKHLKCSNVLLSYSESSSSSSSSNELI